MEMNVENVGKNAKMRKIKENNHKTPCLFVFFVKYFNFKKFYEFISPFYDSRSRIREFNLHSFVFQYSFKIPSCF